MFKEQLHTSFDSIRPAPELLDRISAMMSEEAAKPKKPIYMNAVKYGGIAAAVVLAAGATIAVVQNANNAGIATENAAVPSTTAAVAAAMPETMTAYDDGEYLKADDAMTGAAAAETTTAAAPYNGEAAEAEAAEEYIAAGEESMNAAEADGGETYFVTSAAPETFTAATSDAAQNGGDDMQIFSAAGTPEGEAHEKNAEAAKDIEAPEAILAIPDAAGAPQYAENYDDRSNSAEPAYFDEKEVCEEDAEPEYDMAEAVPTEQYSLRESTDDPQTGGGDTMQFEEPFIYRFYDIPKSLQLSVEGIIEERTDEWGDKYTVMGEKWHEFIGTYAELTPDDEDVPPVSSDDPPTFKDITSVNEDFNIYTFIKYFNVPDGTVREALTGILTEEQTDVLLSGDETAITREFASEYAIVKGDRIYAPLWLYRYPTDEWTAAGITRKDIKDKYYFLSHIPYLREDYLETIIEKMDEYLK